MFEGRKLKPPPGAVVVANITKCNQTIMILSSIAAEQDQQGAALASLLEGRLLGMGQLLGNTGDEVVLKPDVGELFLLDRIDQVKEVFLDVGKLAAWDVGGLAAAVLGDPLGVGTDASVTGNAAVRVAAEGSVVLDRLFIEVWVIWVGGFDLDDSFLLNDLSLVLSLGFLLRRFLGGALGGTLAGNIRNGDHILLIQGFGSIADGILDVVDTRVSDG